MAITYAKSIITDEMISDVVESMKTGWFGVGPKTREFEKRVSKYLGKEDGVFVNSGSSANLLAVSILKSNMYKKNLIGRKFNSNFVATLACGFPTTLNPIIQCGLKPFFINARNDYNIDPDELIYSIKRGYILAAIIPHTLGKPIEDIDKIAEACKEKSVLLIEDCCDAFSSEYDNQPVGSFGDISTLSFYPAHHISTGGGGLVSGNTKEYNTLLRSLRDWGRDCTCSSENSTLENGACGNRFGPWLKGLDNITDHKYIYGEIGYNLQPLELQACLGLRQLDYFEEDNWKQKRIDNYKKIYNGVKHNSDIYNIIKPSCSEDKSQPCWFAFPIRVKYPYNNKKHEIVSILENNQVRTRPIFAGNFMRHKAYGDIDFARGRCLNFGLEDAITTDAFFVGCHQHLTEDEINTIINSLNLAADKSK